MKQRIFIDALRVAKSKRVNHSQGSYAHYSFIVQNNCIIGYGVNMDGDPLIHWGYKSNKSDPTYSPKIHSEINAYRKLKGLLDKNKSFEIINIRLNKLGELRNSKPCQCCSELLADLGCKKIHYSCECGFLSK